VTKLPKLKEFMAGLHQRRRKALPLVSEITWDAKTSTLRIVPPPPSANEMQKWHFRKRMRYRDQVFQHLQTLKLPKFSGKVAVTHVWRLASMERDEDNCVYGLKYVLDGLQKVGMVQNDKAFAPLFGGQQAGGKGARSHACVELRFQEFVDSERAVSRFKRAPID